MKRSPKDIDVLALTAYVWAAGIGLAATATLVVSTLLTGGEI